MYETILIPLDVSNPAEAALSHVEDIARCYEVQVILLHVVEMAFGLVSPYNAILDVESRDERDRRKKVNIAERYLAARRAELREKGINTRIRVELGPIVETILEVAHQEEIDLIIMTSRGRNGLARLFHNSIATSVRDQGDRAILLICPQNSG